MFDIFRTLMRIYKLKFNNNINISSLHEVKIIRHDKWNEDKLNPQNANGKYICRVYFKDSVDLSEIELNNPEKSNFKSTDEIDKLLSKSFAYITYRTLTGQIGLFFINNKENENRNLGKQILMKVITDMKNEGRDSIFAVTSNDHPFWSNVFDKSFKWKKRPHLSVTGSGYSLDLTTFNQQHYQNKIDKLFK